MNILKLVLQNKSGYERQQERFLIIAQYIDRIKLSDLGIDIDGLIDELIKTDTQINFKLNISDKPKTLVKKVIKN